jgi:heat shock protein HtpX
MIPPAVAERRSIATHFTAGLILAVVVFVVLVAVGLGALVAALASVLIGVCVAGLVYLRQEAIVLKAIQATPIDEGEQPRLENLVEGICVANGFRRPTLHLIDDAAPNMLMVGRHPRHAALAVTRGLLTALGRVELEALIAHELTRMRNRTTQVESAFGVVIARPLTFAPGLASRFVGRFLDPDVTTETDVVSVNLTRYPPGLAVALTILRSDGRVPVANPWAFRHMWVDPPEGSVAPQRFTLDDRIAVLEEL